MKNGFETLITAFKLVIISFESLIVGFILIIITFEPLIMGYLMCRQEKKIVV